MNYKKFQGISINKTLATQIIFVVAVASVILIFEKLSDKEPFAEFDKSKEAALLVDFDNIKRMFAGEVIGGMTILDALNASVAAGQIKLTYYVDSDNNTRVKEINDHTTNRDIQFTFYINSRKIDQSELNKTPIRPGDKITIKLE